MHNKNIAFNGNYVKKQGLQEIWDRLIYLSVGLYRIYFFYLTT